MNKLTAQNIIKAIDPFKRYLFRNEYEKIKECVYHYVNEPETKQERTGNNESNEEPPLKGLWNLIWSKRISAPIAIYIGLFTIGLLIGYYI